MKYLKVSNLNYQDFDEMFYQANELITSLDSEGVLLFSSNENKREYHCPFEEVNLPYWINKKGIQYEYIIEIDGRWKENNVYLYLNDTFEEGGPELIINELDNLIYSYPIEARGYSQSDYECFMFVTKRPLTDEEYNTLKTLKYYFTAMPVYVELIEEKICECCQAHNEEVIEVYSESSFNSVTEDIIENALKYFNDKDIDESKTIIDF